MPDVTGQPADRGGAGSEYGWEPGLHAHNHSVLIPALAKILADPPGRRLLDLGCGNGSLTNSVAAMGFEVVGSEYSESGLAGARASFPDIDFVAHDIATPMPAKLTDRFDVVLAAEVIEHLFLPRTLFARAAEALAPGGQLVITTPYHSWTKNLALAVTNKFDHHWRPGWDHGHIKFFSRATLTAMAQECDFEPVGFYRVGRIPPLAMSMILVCRRAAG